MPQFYVPPQKIVAGAVTFEPEEAHHLLKVLRKKPGDVVRVFDGGGFCAAVRLLPGAGRELQGEILEEIPSVRRKCRLEIYPALLRQERFQWLLEKTTELGVAGIHPLLTQRTLIRIPEREAAGKLEKWRRSVVAAAKQCGRSDLPEISAALPLRQALSGGERGSIDLILWEGEDQKDLSQIISGLTVGGGTGTAPAVRLFIGPEGGFALEEVDLARKAGIVPVSLGESILRAETAAVAAAALILL